MPDTNVWRGCATAVAQVDTCTPGGTIEADDEFTITLTDDQGNTESITAVAGGTTVADVCDALIVAAAAAYGPLFASVTLADVTTHVSVTADEAGVPFACTCTTTETGGGGADAQTFVQATTTASRGPNDYNTPENWSLGLAPVATDHVEIPPDTSAIMYGLDQSAVAIGNFVRHIGHATEIGRVANGLMNYLRIKPDAVAIRGSGSLVAIDVGAEAIAIAIEHTGFSTGNRQHAVYVKGSAITEVHCEVGYAAVAGWAGDTATVSSRLAVSGGTVKVGPGVTVAGVTLDQSGGTVLDWAGIPTVNARGATTSYKCEDGNWTTLNAYDGAKVYPNASGTYATTNLHDGAAVHNTEKLNTKTFTNTEMGANTAIYDPAETITYTNPKTYPEGREAVAAGVN